jgi:polyisoprenyl-phosphate glycosyltransferase
VSVAIPLHNEEPGIPELLRRTRAALDAIPGGGPHEIVLVDDGSTDRTLALLEAAAAGDDRVVVISLSRNFGHQAALTAALDHVSGDATLVMDGDLQDPPELIPAFLEQYAKGYDVVYAQRRRRKEAWWLRLCYFVFYRLLDAGDFALMSRRVVEQLRRAPERHRFLRGLRSWVGFRQVGLPVERLERETGKSKYGLRRLLGLAFDGLFAFSIVPIRLTALLGAIAMALSTAFALYALYARLVLRQSPQGFTALILVITFLAGINLFFLGIVGEYVGRVYEEVKRRPLYIIGRVIRRAPADPPPAGPIP